MVQTKNPTTPLLWIIAYFAIQPVWAGLTYGSYNMLVLRIAFLALVGGYLLYRQDFGALKNISSARYT